MSSSPRPGCTAAAVCESRAVRGRSAGTTAVPVSTESPYFWLRQAGVGERRTTARAREAVLLDGFRTLELRVPSPYEEREPTGDAARWNPFEEIGLPPPCGSRIDGLPGSTDDRRGRRSRSSRTSQLRATARHLEELMIDGGVQGRHGRRESGGTRQRRLPRARERNRGGRTRTDERRRRPDDGEDE